MLISTTNVTNLSNALRAFIDAKTPSGAVRKYRLPSEPCASTATPAA